MKPENNNNNSDRYYGIYDDDFDAGLCSSNDCTGMVSNGLGDLEELERYRQMYNFGVSCEGGENSRSDMAADGQYDMEDKYL